MTAAIILAAGEGRRMGGPKALLPYEGETLLHRAARTALEAGCSPVIAVVGDWNPGLEGVEVLPVLNPVATEGMASSIRTGIAALPLKIPAVLLLTVDQPAVDTSLLRRLLALAATDPDRPAACAYAGTLGIPAVLPRRCFPDLLALRGDVGAKAILLREAAQGLPFSEGARDLDFPEDLPPDSIRR
ncbi:nucleotidyltransferase family protein [Geothrix alkalitolerans]|uniref:nucleotidyltransferase family protein n=1 Tax=Geothrix alkalitolerans TaxID=2922724 RepID=UPI001FB0183B